MAAHTAPARFPPIEEIGTTPLRAEASQRNTGPYYRVGRCSGSMAAVVVVRILILVLPSQPELNSRKGGLKDTAKARPVRILRGDLLTPAKHILYTEWKASGHGIVDVH